MTRHAFICDAVRTPFGRYGGSLSSVRADDLGAVPLQALMARHPNLDWEAVADIVYGCANQAGEDNRNVARMSALLAGLPLEIRNLVQDELEGREFMPEILRVKSVSRFATPPAMGRVQITPNKSNARVWPSGEADTAILVPSVIVTLRCEPRPAPAFAARLGPERVVAAMAVPPRDIKRRRSTPGLPESFIRLSSPSELARASSPART
eukprot:gene19970-39541_t